MELVAFWLLFGGYLLFYWGVFLLNGKHVEMACIALGRGCPT